MIADTLINTTTSGDQMWPAIAVLTDGDFVISWESYGQDGGGVYAQRFATNGSKQGNEFIINSYTVGFQEISVITALQDGGFVVGWESFEQDGDGGGIYAQRFDSAGSKQGEAFRANTYTADYQTLPVMASLQPGGFVVSWVSAGQDGEDGGIYAQRFDALGEGQGGEFPVNTHFAGNQGAPVIAALQGGGFVISWVSDSQDGEGEGIYAQRFGAGGEKLNGEFSVNTHFSGNQGDPAIAVLQDGGFVISWVSDGQDGEGEGIYAQRFDAGGDKQGGEFLVNTTTAGNQSQPTVTALQNGSFVVIWMSEGQDGDLYGIYAQRFDADGVKQGEEFRVNAYNTGNQFEPKAIALQDGGFAVIWTSDGQDGDGFGIYAQRFDAAGTNVAWSDPSALPVADRLFNWAESAFSDLFPGRQESIEISGYYARLYESGNALGEQNGNIYFYDGQSITLVGTVGDFLPDAMTAGF
ncbi:MAG: hypothetical protein LZF61_07500 [Nitrosomonas sp.]|nr:MAG: hypothetical protein LZF61_07500 [Nitrosomonas sp.]